MKNATTSNIKYTICLLQVVAVASGPGRAINGYIGGTRMYASWMTVWKIYSLSTATWVTRVVCSV